MLVVKTTSPATSPPPAKLHPSKTAPSSRTTVARLRPYSNLRSRPVVVYKLSTNYSTHHPTRQSPPVVRGVRRPAQERLPAHRPPLREVHKREVRPFSGRDPTSFTHPAPRRAAHRLDEPQERDPTPENQFRVKRREGRLVSEETRRCLLEGQLLLLGGVRCVIRRHEIEDALTQGLDNPLAIFFRPEGWVYPVHPIERGDQAVRQRQVVRRGIRGDVRPIFEVPDESRRERGRDVGYVDLRPRLGREHERRGRRRVLGAGRRARDPGKRGIDPVVHDARGERVVLAVQDHGQARRTRVEHPIAQHARRSRPEPVVRDAERAGLLEQAHLREALAFEPRVHGGGDVGPHPALFLDAPDEATHDDWPVHDGIRIGHHHDPGEAAGGGRRRAALDALLVLAARRAPVGVHVHEAGEEVEPIGVQLARAPQPVAYLGDAALADAHVGDAVETVARVEDVCLADNELGRGPVAAVQAATSCAAPVASARTAERTWTPAATWSGIRDEPSRTTSPEISTPLLTGPGCMTRTPSPRCRLETP